MAVQVNGLNEEYKAYDSPYSINSEVSIRNDSKNTSKIEVEKEQSKECMVNANGKEAQLIKLKPNTNKDLPTENSKLLKKITSPKTIDKDNDSKEATSKVKLKRFRFTKSHSTANSDSSKLKSSYSMYTLDNFSKRSPSLGIMRHASNCCQESKSPRLRSSSMVAQSKPTFLQREKNKSLPNQDSARPSPCMQVRRTTSFEVGSHSTSRRANFVFEGGNALISPQMPKFKGSASDLKLKTNTPRRKDGMVHSFSSYSSSVHSSNFSTPFSSLQSTPSSSGRENASSFHLPYATRDPNWVPISPYSFKSSLISSELGTRVLSKKRVRSHEGSGLTIRIPRHFSDKGLPTSTQPLMSPTQPHVLLSTMENSRVVSKSKSLTTSMDKLGISHGLQRVPSSGSSSRESSFAGSRGSTPSNTRSAVNSRPPSRRSTPSRDTKPPRTPDRHTPEKDGQISKPDSPTGSEVSLNSSASVHSSTHSVNSTHSRNSSNTSAKSQASNLSCPSGQSSNGCSPRASSEPPRGTPIRKRTPSREAPKSKSQNGINKSSKQATNAKKSSSSSLSHSPSEDKRSDSTPPRQISRRSTPSRFTPSRSNSSTSSIHHTTVGGGSQRKSLPVFNSYMSLFQVQEKLKKGEVIEGVLRINPNNYDDAFISAPVLLGRGDGHLYWRGT